MTPDLARDVFELNVEVGEYESCCLTSKFEPFRESGKEP